MPSNLPFQDDVGMNTPTCTASFDGGLFTVTWTAQYAGTVEVAPTVVALFTVVLGSRRVDRLSQVDACRLSAAPVAGEAKRRLPRAATAADAAATRLGASRPGLTRA
jgi:hypothetical protein